MRAQRLIRRGEEITARYGGLNLGQPRRGQLLFDHWRFSCSCARCISILRKGIKCAIDGTVQVCRPHRARHLQQRDPVQGARVPRLALVSKKNISLNSEKYFVLPSPHRALVWRCTSCGDTQPLDLVLKLVRDAETFIRNNVGSTVDTDTLEHTVHQLETTFHPHHYLIAQLKLVLVTKYSLVQGT